MDTNLFFEFVENYKVKISDLIDTFSSFKDKINKIYLELAQILQDDIDGSLKKSSIGFNKILKVIDYKKVNINNNGTDKEDNIGIMQLLELNQRNLTEITNPIRLKSDKSSESFSKSLKYLSEINRMMTSVDIVQEFSSEMEVLSYNSIIIASKAGEKGQGFRSISGYINKLSKETNSKFQELKNTSQKVLDKYDSYNFLIINTRNVRIEKGYNIYNKSKNFFTKSKSLTNKISNVLVDINEQIDNTKKSMYNFILELQNEDIVNQILSNLLIQLKFLLEFINTLEKNKLDYINLSDEKTIKDLYLFFNEVDGFLLDKIKKIKKTLDKLLELLINSLNDFSNITLKCKDSLNSVVDKLDNKSNTDITENFLYQSADLTKEYQNLITQLIGYQGEINTIGNEFLENLNEVDKVYSKLEDIIENMQSVNVLVKIEMAREKIEINKSNDTGVVMEKMLKKIGEYLTNLINNFRNTKDKLNELMKKINESVIQQKNKYLSTNKLLQEFLSEFYQKANFCNEEIKISISSLRQVMENVNYIISKVKNEINSIKNLIQVQNKEIIDLEKNKEKIRNLLKELFNIEEPNINMIKYEDIINLLNEIEKRQNKASLNKYLNDSFDFKEKSNIVIF